MRDNKEEMFNEQERQLQPDACKVKKNSNFVEILKKLSVSLFETGFSFVSAAHTEHCKLIISDYGMMQ